jgi:hypothetical protein
VLKSFSFWWRIAEALVLLGYVVYVLVTGNGPRRLFVSTAAAFAATLAAVALLVGLLFVLIR